MFCCPDLFSTLCSHTSAIVNSEQQRCFSTLPSHALSATSFTCHALCSRPKFPRVCGLAIAAPYHSFSHASVTVALHVVSLPCYPQLPSAFLHKIATTLSQLLPVLIAPLFQRNSSVETRNTPLSLLPCQFAPACSTLLG